MCHPLSAEQLAESERHFVEYVTSRGITPRHPMFGLFRSILISGSDMDAKQALIDFMKAENAAKVCKRCLGDGTLPRHDGYFSNCTLCHGSGTLLPMPV